MSTHTTFIARLSSLFKDNASERYVSRMKTGKVDFKRLSRIAYSERLFKKRLERKGKNYNVSVLVDASGSMSEWGFGTPGKKRKIHVAIEAVNALMDALGKVGINHELSAFNAGDYILRPFTRDKVTEKTLSAIQSDLLHLVGVEPDTSPEALPVHVALGKPEAGLVVQTSYRLYLGGEKEEAGDIEKRYGLKAGTIEVVRYGHVAGHNNDGKAVHDAIARLRKQPDGKNILLVLSDGQPAPLGRNVLCEGRTDARHYQSFELEEEVKSAIKKGVTVLAVGICSNSVEAYYPNGSYAVIYNLEDLYPAIIKLLSKNIVRGE